MLFRNSPYKMYLRFAISVLLIAGGFAIGHGLKIVGIAFAAWSAWVIVRDRGRAGHNVNASGDQFGTPR